MGRPPKLDRADYRGAKTVAFTYCVRNRGRAFVDRDELVRQCTVRLTELGQTHQCNIPIYCFMPDHLHLMIQGFDFGSDPLLVMDKFCQFLGRRLFALNLPGMQNPPYDHIIRSGEDWRRQAAYIAMNPVRAGLVESYLDYPYVGCLNGDIRDFFL